MSKIIIDNRTTITDVEALQFVAAVVRHGRVSNDGKQYCYAVRFPECVVCSGLNEKSDRFILLPPQKTPPPQPDDNEDWHGMAAWEAEIAAKNATP